MFIKHSKVVYGVEFLVYNVHTMCHISDDVRIFGVLDKFSAFPFENYLGSLKNLLKSPNKLLQQIVKRILEIESTPFMEILSNYSVAYSHLSKDIPDKGMYECFKEIMLNEYVLCIKSYRSADCFFLTKNKKVLEIENI